MVLLLWHEHGIPQAVPASESPRRVADWYELLATYHDAVLGWVGGTERIDGRAPPPAAVEDRLALIRHAMQVLFPGRPTFEACWTYITCVNGR